MFNRRYASGRGSSLMPRLIIGAIIAIISLVTYFSAQVHNPVTDEVQHIDMTVEQEIALGLQAAPEMAEQYGGLDPDQSAQALVDRVGRELFLERRPAVRRINSSSICSPINRRSMLLPCQVVLCLSPGHC